MIPETVKDPQKVRAGKASARKRWGETPRIVRLDALTDEQRRLVVALVDAAKTAPVSEMSEAARSEVGHDRPDPTD